MLKVEQLFRLLNKNDFKNYDEVQTPLETWTQLGHVRYTKTTYYVINWHCSGCRLLVWSRSEVREHEGQLL